MAIIGVNSLLNQYTPVFTISGLADGQTLTYDSTKKAFVNAMVRVETLGELDNVSPNVDDPLSTQNGQALVYNTTTGLWTNLFVDYTTLLNKPTSGDFSFAGLSDTATPSLPDGYVLWNSAGDELVYSTTIPAASITGLATVATTGQYSDLLGIPGNLGTVTSVSVVSANGIAGVVATPTTTPAITLTLGNITPSGIASTGAITGTNLSGTNTGDQTITLTGDVTGSGTGSFASTLATVNSTVGSFGSGVLVPQITVDGKGRITNVVNVAISTSGVGTVTSVTANGTQGVTTQVVDGTTTPAITIGLGAITPTSVLASGTIGGSNFSGSSSGTNTGNQTITLTGDVTGSGTASFAATLSNSGVAANTYGSATQVPVFTVDAKGRITGVTNTNITASGTVTSVAASGGTTGMSFSGGPITGAGTLTLAGTLTVANGGTGQTTAPLAFNALAPTQTGNSGKFLSTNGTVVSWETLATTLDAIEPGTGAGKVLYLNGSNLWAQALPGATSGVQAYDAGLDALATKTTTGLLVQTGVDTYVSRTLVQPLSGILIANASGVVGDITFTLNDDLSALEALSGTGFAVRSGASTWAQRSITGTTDRISITNGDGIAGAPTIDMSTVAQAGTGSFVKVTLDGYGRVTGNTSVVASDITALVSGTYVDITGDAMTGNLVMSAGATITGIPTPINATDVANKSYVDNAVIGLTWKNAAQVLVTTNVVVAGDTNPLDGVTLITGDRVVLTGQTDPSENGIYVATVTGGDYVLARSTDAAIPSQLSGAAIFIQQGTLADSGWTQTVEPLAAFADQNWGQFAGGGTLSAGTGIDITGTVVSVRLGAGITDVPTGEVGIDIATGKAVQLTNGTTGGQLTFVLDTGSGLEQSATGLKVSNNGITNSMLFNSALTLDADTGTGIVSLGGTLNIVGNATQGVSTSVATGDYTITVADATVSTKGVASFNTASFSVTAGAVSLSTVDVAHGGTGATSFTATELLYGNGTSALAHSSALTFATDTLTIGSATIQGAATDVTITATGADGNIILVLDTGAVPKVTISGPTPTEYATGLVDADLTNKKYVDTAIAAGSPSGSIKAVTATVPLNANGTTSIGAPIPANAIVLSVKVNVTIADTAATISIGEAVTDDRYMTAIENDPQLIGLYMGETYDSDVSSIQIIATVASTAATASSSCQVMVEYQVA